MHLPLQPPVAPMLAKAAPAIPAGMLYEPKWDGFRCIVFHDGAEVELGSRNERPLTRYFPEIVETVRAQLPRCVLDGELIISRNGRLDFEALLQRIHPAASRVRLLAAETPAAYVAFDVLADGDDSLLTTPFAQRRERLLGLLADVAPPIHVTPATDDEALAQRWFTELEGAGLDGVVAKAPDLLYRPDERAMVKVKHKRTVDCVVAGFRWHKSGGMVGSLLLGLNDDAGRLQSVGVVAAFPTATRKALVEELAPLRTDLEGHPWAGWATGGGDGDRMPGGETSRWNRGKDLSWEPLRPERVVEVSFDYMEGRRFRHTAQFVRWRPDRDPSSCTFAQLDRPLPVPLERVLADPGLRGGR